VLTQFARLNHTNPSDQAAATSLAHNRSRQPPAASQFGFEKMVGDDQRLDGLAGVTAAGRDSLVGSTSTLPYGY
jgi:hypothetical protein